MAPDTGGMTVVFGDTEALFSCTYSRPEPEPSQPASL